MDEAETLKLIDYDGAIFIPVGLFENPRKLANKVVPREFYIATSTYAAIEYYEENTLLTTKMDMWALGIIIYELILVQATFNERISMGKITQILMGIGNIYLGIQRNSKGMKQTDESFFENDSWAKNNCGSLMAILNVWQKYPKTALLITNLLHPDKEARMSAIGIKNFLSGFCLTEELKRDDERTEREGWQLIAETVGTNVRHEAERMKRAEAEEERAKDWREGGEWRVKRAEAEEERTEIDERGAKRADWMKSEWRIEGNELIAKRAEQMKSERRIGEKEASGTDEERAKDWREASEWRAKRAEQMKSERKDL
ncbi:hypothetical protein niasHT_035290 [Heterodera trifolii]|uniref:Protein kinase domain-containing protein n=1 Tax=Heterodera trifolii TaxID=157864 RepID=A0ABD2J253_9BILA